MNILYFFDPDNKAIDVSILYHYGQGFDWLFNNMIHHFNIKVICGTWTFRNTKNYHTCDHVSMIVCPQQGIKKENCIFITYCGNFGSIPWGCHRPWLGVE